MNDNVLYQILDELKQMNATIGRLTDHFVPQSSMEKLLQHEEQLAKVERDLSRLQYPK